MKRKEPNGAASVTDLVFDTLSQMQRWGADFDVERLTDTTIHLAFADGAPSVLIRVSRPKPKA